ncbi:MAG: helix-turn-helix domain-containing protein [Phycisphaeraceae bacterium]
MLEKTHAHDPKCKISDVLDIFKGRWKGEIIKLLSEQALRFSELKTQLTSASARVLTESLRALERDGVIQRNDLSAPRPHVEYSLSPYGVQLVPLLDQIKAWGEKHINCVRTCRDRYDAAHAGPH